MLATCNIVCPFEFDLEMLGMGNSLDVVWLYLNAKLESGEPLLCKVLTHIAVQIELDIVSVGRLIREPR